MFPIDKNIEIYQRYIVYRRILTRYFMKIYQEDKKIKKYRQNIVDISTIYWLTTINQQFCQLIAAHVEKSPLFWVWFDNSNHARVDLTTQIRLASNSHGGSPSNTLDWIWVWSNSWDDIPTVTSRSNGHISPRFWAMAKTIFQL